MNAISKRIAIQLYSLKTNLFVSYFVIYFLFYNLLIFIQLTERQEIGSWEVPDSTQHDGQHRHQSQSTVEEFQTHHSNEN